MKKTFTFLALLVALIARAGTPVIDGVITPGEGWILIGSGDNLPGWSNVNAKNLYGASDANYYYIGAEVTASSWMSWAFIINGAPLGGPSDSWSRQIIFDHANKPDLTCRGNFGASPNYAEFHTWNPITSTWAGLGTNVNVTGAEAKSNITGTDQNGFLELRIPKSGAIATIASFDIQFYVTGDQNNHGSFDAIPTDSIAHDWMPPGSITHLHYYLTVDSSLLPLNLLSFSGAIQNKSLLIKWTTCNEINVSHYDVEFSPDAIAWSKGATVTAKNVSESCDYHETVAAPSKDKYYARLKMVDKDYKFVYSRIIKIRQDVKANFEVLQNPAKSTLKISGNCDAGTIKVSLVSVGGKKVLSTTQQHSGGELLFQMDVSGVQPGMYFLNIDNGVDRQVIKMIIQ